MTKTATVTVCVHTFQTLIPMSRENQLKNNNKNNHPFPIKANNNLNVWQCYCLFFPLKFM